MYVCVFLVCGGGRGLGGGGGIEEEGLGGFGDVEHVVVVDGVDAGEGFCGGELFGLDELA